MKAIVLFVCIMNCEKSAMQCLPFVNLKSSLGFHKKLIRYSVHDVEPYWQTYLIFYWIICIFNYYLKIRIFLVYFLFGSHTHRYRLPTRTNCVRYLHSRFPHAPKPRDTEWRQWYIVHQPSLKRRLIKKFVWYPCRPCFYGTKWKFGI